MCGKSVCIILVTTAILAAFAIGFLTGLIISDVIAYNYIQEITIARADIE